MDVYCCTLNKINFNDSCCNTTTITSTSKFSLKSSVMNYWWVSFKLT